MKKKSIAKTISICIFLILEEMIFGFNTINSFGDVLLKIIFSIIIAIIIDITTNIFKEKNNKRLLWVFVILITVVNYIYIIFFKLLNNILSIDSIVNAITQSGKFSSIFVKKMIENWYIVLELGCPIILIAIISKFIAFDRKSIKYNAIELIIIVVLYGTAMMTIQLTSNNDQIYSAKNLYTKINNPWENAKKFGMITTIRLDVQRKIFGFKEIETYEYIDEYGNDKVIDKEKYNIMDVDFETAIKNTNDEEIKETLNYLKSQDPTNKNEYTGKYKDKNLIVFVAESFSNLAIKEEVTPTLYKLANKGLKFNNFYTPLFPVSTADGEYLTDTSLIPAEGVWSIEKVEGKTFPFSYANKLKQQGYKTYAYHDNDYDYYKRDIYFKTMGYDKYLAIGNGLEERITDKNLQNSDYEMVKNTIDDYINDDKFVAYYMTMSGHMNYVRTNPMVEKNWDKVKDLPYSENARGYLSTQIELDKALEEVINKLNEAGKLEDTVIIITGDHYPYGLTFKEMQELSEKELDDEFEKFNMPLIIYNSEDEDKEINKICSSLDVLPTMLNLFGIEYDSRLLMGKDIFSKEDSTVIFSNRNFITTKGRYNSMTEQFEKNSDDNTIVDNAEYVKKIEEQIYKKYKYSRLILTKNIYSLLKNIE